MIQYLYFVLLMLFINTVRGFQSGSTKSILITRLFSSKMQKKIVDDPTSFDKELDLATVTNKPTFLYFTGAKNANNGLSWCPDCTRAEPIVNEIFSEVDCNFLEFNVIREDYRSEDYIYRKDSRIQLKCVPTLILWKNGKSIATLNDSQCQKKDIVKDILDLI